jgi:hypothetical protein
MAFGILWTLLMLHYHVTKNQKPPPPPKRLSRFGRINNILK